jgi:hypothetical protein
MLAGLSQTLSQPLFREQLYGLLQIMFTKIEWRDENVCTVSGMQIATSPSGDAQKIMILIDKYVSLSVQHRQVSQSRLYFVCA